MALSEAFRISMGTPTIYKIVEFLQNYRTSKQISTDEENPTTIDEFGGYECDGYRISDLSSTGNHYYYKSINFYGHTFSNLIRKGPHSINLYLDGEDWGGLYDPYKTIYDPPIGFMVVYFESTHKVNVMAAFGTEGSSEWCYQGIPTSGESYHVCTSPIEVDQKSEVSIDLDTWNTNIDWLDELIESGDDTYISIDSDSYEEVSDPEELADTIMDAITDNDYEGTIAESPEPISYATTVKAALDTLYDSLGTNDLNLVSVPASASATGSVGDVAYDDNYLYLCTATNTWVRSALSTWT